MAQPEMRSIVDVAKASINVYNEKNWERARASLAPDCTYEEIATNQTAHGVNEVVSLWQGWAKAMPDSKGTVDKTFFHDNMVALELTWRGTHSGPLQTPRGEIAPTGKRFEVRACQVFEVSGERAKSVRHYFDMNTLLQQLEVRV